MNGLTFLLVFGMGLTAGVLMVLWNDSPNDPEIQRRIDKWDGTR